MVHKTAQITQLSTAVVAACSLDIAMATGCCLDTACRRTCVVCVVFGSNMGQGHQHKPWLHQDLVDMVLATFQVQVSP